MSTVQLGSRSARWGRSLKNYVRCCRVKGVFLATFTALRSKYYTFSYLNKSLPPLPEMWHVSLHMGLAFSHRKATQALNWLARHAGGRLNKMAALKLVYFADRYHVRKYGRPVTGDTYLAMNFGPVPSCTKDIAYLSEFLSNHERSYAETYLQRSDVDAHSFESRAATETRVFSETDIEALDFAWTQFGRFDQFALADITHDYPEWKRHQAALKSQETTRVPMHYAAFLDDAPATVNPCHPLTAAEVAERREMLAEMESFENRWN
jgi:uncharacterized phage-associated protein